MCDTSGRMSDEKKKPEPKVSIETFKILPQPFGRLTVLASSLATGGLPQDAFKATGERKPSTKPPVVRQSPG